jgi:multidrug efflux system membrane fusion protein
MTQLPKVEGFDAPERPAERRRIWRHWWLLLVALGASSVFLVAPTDRPRGKVEAQPPPVPVVIAEARQQDVPVYLSGLGSVTPLATVTVRSRVDGQLMRVAFVEGQAVTKGSLLAEIDPRPFEAQLLAAEGQLSRDQALLENARRDLERYRFLATKDSIARQQYDTQKSVVAQDEGNVEADRAQIETAKLNIVYSRITAPVSGRVGLRLVDPGNIVHATDTGGIVVVTQMKPMSVIFTVPEDQLPPVLEKVRAGERLEVDAFDRTFRELAKGSLLTTDNLIDQTTGTVRLKAIFDNDDEALFPNQFVNARLLLDVIEKATVVPTAALQRTAQRVFVYVVKPDGSAEVRDVKTGPESGDATSITSGIAVGERVVLDGADRVRQGARVVARPPGDAGVEGGAP